MTLPVYVGQFAHAVGECCESLAEAEQHSRLVSSADALRQGGFVQHHYCGSDTSAYELATRVTQQFGRDLGCIDAIVYATCLPENACVGDRAGFVDSGDVRRLMEFPASRLQTDFGLDAPVIGLNQQACTGMLGALRLARNYVVAESEFRRIFCLTADRFPQGARYEQAYNLISDGAAACIVSSDPAEFAILSCHHITNGAQVTSSDDEFVGSYFSYSCDLINQALKKAQLRISDIDWIVPQNTHRDAWRILAGLIGFPYDHVYFGSLPDVGHVISADNIVNLRYLIDEVGIDAGERVLLPMAGYGSNFQSIILERTSVR